MRVNRIAILVLLLLSVKLSAAQLGSIGYVSPNYPPFPEKYKPSQDTAEFFEEFLEMAFDNYGDAAVSVINKLNLKRTSVRHHDVVYKNRILIPGDDNFDTIMDFYESRSRAFMLDVAKKNKVDVILFSRFKNSTFKRVLKLKKEKNQEDKLTKLMYQIFVYDAQSGATKQKMFEVEVEDLFFAPDYDGPTLQAKFEDNYIAVFSQVFKSMQNVGSAYSASSISEQPNSSVEVDRKQEQINAANEASGGDW
jgi:hypothetical protein